MRRFAKALLVVIGLGGLPLAAPDAPANEAGAQRPRDGAGYPLDHLDRLALRESLRQREFDELERVLAELQRAFEQDFREERRVAHAFGAFADLGPEGERALDAWVKQSPESWVVQLALGRHRASQAWRARGGATRSKTSNQQFQTMRAFFDAADRALDAALAANPKLAHAWELRLDIARATGRKALRESALREALAIHPLLARARERYLIGSTRRWGGSYAELERLGAGFTALAADNPGLAALAGWADYDRGRDQPKCVGAIPFYDAALRRGEHPNYLKRRAFCHNAMGDPARAIADLNRALVLQPQDADLLTRRARALARAGAMERALADVKTAQSLDPHDARLGELAQAYRAKHEFEAFQAEPTVPEAVAWGSVWLLRYLATSVGVLGLLALWLALRARAAARGDRAAAEALALDPGQGLGSRVWRLYATLIILLHAAVYGFAWRTAGEVEHVDAAITFVALLGLAAYVLRVRLLSARFWQLWAVVFPSWNVFYHFVIGHARLEEWPLWGFTHLILLPTYAALCLYGWRSTAIWGDPEAVPLVHRGAEAAGPG
ncbi:MAG: DUF4034 domain-containing protein [Myxococcota bacterium]|nr:DUF4034 domain-containing protein [Myxococcota bacterium]